jgi:hypothetical protein
MRNGFVAGAMRYDDKKRLVGTEEVRQSHR